LYAILDIETSGGAFNQERITEIAIYKYDGHDIIDHFESLVNPQKKIQEFVVKLTGITDKMVARAPKFHEVAKRIVEITEGCTLVAHNSDFDYRVLRNEFKSLGFSYSKDTLCTVQLSQELLPDLPSYSLGKLCKSLGIPVSGRHRAGGDAYATVSLFELLLQKDDQKKIISKRIKNASSLLKKEKITTFISSLPNRIGVFYFHQENGRIMYIAKGTNMRKKLKLILAKKSKKTKAIQSKLASISYDETGNYTMASLLFNQEISKHNPRYNSNYLKKTKPIEFAHPDMILVGKGRRIGEKSIIYIKDGNLEGFAYTDLEHQVQNIDILKNKLNTLENSLDNRHIVKTGLQQNKIDEIIRL